VSALIASGGQFVLDVTSGAGRPERLASGVVEVLRPLGRGPAEFMTTEEALHDAGT
jgi:hypothetical protein